MLKEIKERRSCRSFDSKMPNEKAINEVINAGLYAASARGTQYGIVIAITNKDVREKLVKLNAKVMEKADFDPFYGAPVILLVAVKKWNNSVYDGSCMIENMMIEATNQGLGSCWIHRAKEELEMEEGKALFKGLNIDLNEYEGLGHVALGYRLNKEIPLKEIKENRVFWIK